MVSVSYTHLDVYKRQALDFMYHHRAHWAFQLKLRDTGNHGFLLPPENIKPVGKETYAALKYFCDFLLDPEI